MFTKMTAKCEETDFYPFPTKDQAKCTLQELHGFRRQLKIAGGSGVAIQVA